MFPMNLLRRLGRDKAPTKDETSRTRRIRARRYVVGLERLEQRQLLTVGYMLLGDGTIVHGGATEPAAPVGSFDLSSYGWNYPPPIIQANPNAGPGGVPASALTITKKQGPASLALLHASVTGESFNSAELLLIPPGGKGNYFECDLANVVVTKWQVSEIPNNKPPTESVTSAFSSFQVKHGTMTSRVTKGRLQSTGWDFRLNQPMTRRLRRDLSALLAGGTRSQTSMSPAG
jgi:type VI protein secretion system component Hcp